MDTNDQIRSTLLKGLLSPWVGVAFLVGFIAGRASTWIG
jgi:hypothetical protein